MKKVWSVFLACLLVLCLSACGEDSSSGTGGEDKPSADVMESNAFSFVYDVGAIPNEYWNALHPAWADFGFTNQRVYNTKYEKLFGNPNGVFSLKPMGFTQEVVVGYEELTKTDENYTLSVKDNAFLYVQQLQQIDDKISHASSELQFYVLGNDLEFYHVRFSIDENPKEPITKASGWEIRQGTSEDGTAHGTTAYYAVNTDYCLKMSFPTAFSKEYVRSMDESSREQYETQYPYTKEQVYELAEKTTALISFTKMEDQGEIERRATVVSLGDVSLDDKTVVHLKGTRLLSWHSGANAIVGNLMDGYPVITAFDKEGTWTYLTELTDESKLQSFLSVGKSTLQDYTYHGRAISLDCREGKCDGIVFSANGKWYSLRKLGNSAEIESNMDAWIDQLCEGFVTLNN